MSIVVQDTVQARSLWQETPGKEGIDNHSRKLGQGLLWECTIRLCSLNVMIFNTELGKRIQEMAWQ